MQCLLTTFKGLHVARYSTALVRLRPYQEHCLDVCTEALASGATRIGVSLPTGSGKTTVFISLLSRILPPVTNPAAVRSLIIVNSVELARQSAEQVAKLLPNRTVEIEQGSKFKASGLADVFVTAVLYLHFFYRRYFFKDSCHIPDIAEQRPYHKIRSEYY